MLCSQPVLVVDLSPCTFMDSTGIGTLVAARRWTTARGARLVLVCGDGSVRRVLELTRVTEVIETQPSLDAALSELAG